MPTFVYSQFTLYSSDEARCFKNSLLAAGAAARTEMSRVSIKRNSRRRSCKATPTVGYVQLPRVVSCFFSLCLLPDMRNSAAKLPRK